jgi:hypothetical protein
MYGLKFMEKNEMSKEEKIGFHKGSISTLAKEQQELMRIVNITEQLMQMHVEELKKLGIDIMKKEDIQ